MRFDGSGSTLDGFKSLEVPRPLRLDGFGSVLDEFSSLWVTLDHFRSGLGRFRSVLDGFGSTQTDPNPPKMVPKTCPNESKPFGCVSMALGPL